MSVDEHDLVKEEYIRLKDEQSKRIGFRDNLLYVHLGLVSTIIAFIFAADLTKETWRPYGLMLVVWVCVILGWNYLVNDEKISAIGRYIRLDLTAKFAGSFEPFGWEVAHRSDKRRLRRKYEQLVIDELSFPGIGFIALSVFCCLTPQRSDIVGLLILASELLLAVLFVEIIVYADLRKGK